MPRRHNPRRSEEGLHRGAPVQADHGGQWSLSGQDFPSIHPSLQRKAVLNMGHGCTPQCAAVRNALNRSKVINDALY